MIQRVQRMEQVERLLRQFPVIGILGIRQCGKTTLAGQLAAARSGTSQRFDLENPVDRKRLAYPMLTLAPLRGLVILDEIQRVPELFPVLRVLADRRPRRTRFLVLGSASPDMLRQSSESLAGRIAYLELEGFSLSEVRTEQLARLWLRGGLPPPSSLEATRTAPRGAEPTSAPSWNGTFHSSESGPRARPCRGSGRCWRTTMGRPGTRRSSPAPSACPISPFVATSIS